MLMTRLYPVHRSVAASSYRVPHLIQLGDPRTARLHAAFGLPLRQRCHEISKLLEEISVKDLYALLPLLLENVFGFGTQVGWSLGQLNRLHQPQEFFVVSQLLSPVGPLLKLINQLSTDSCLRFEFPVSCIPLPSQQLIDQGCISALYADKLQFNQAGKLYGMVSLSAFEYYFFHFAYHLVNSQHQKVPPWSNPTDVVYPTLVEEYLNYFLPLYSKASAGHVMPRHVTSPTMHQSPLLHQSVSSPQSLSFSKFPFSSLLRSPGQSQHTTTMEYAEQETWRSQSFLQIVVEFWLNQTSLDIERYTYTQPSTPGHWFDLSQRFRPIDPHQYIVLESFLPTGDHVRVVRMMVKHTHYFVNSASVSLTPSPYNPIVTCPLDEFKRGVIPQLLQKKMYAFLRHGFERWPLDSSFRLLMETWLSFIQPWRYTDPTQSNVDRVADIKDRIIDKNWRQFVVDNLLFYSVLSQQFLHRAFRMDVSAPKNAYMLFRVAKVFNLPNLRNMLVETEQAMYSPIHQLPRAPGQSPLGDAPSSYLSPAHQQHTQLTAILAMQFAELERPGFLYQPLFHDNTLALVSQLLQVLRQARETAKTFGQKLSETDWSLSSFLGLGPSVDYNASRFYNSDPYDDTGNSGDWQRVETHLEQAESYLCNFFEMEPPSGTSPAADLSLWGGGVNNTTVIKGQGHDSQDLAPDTLDTEEGPQLTPLGRYQLVNGLRKFNIDYQGDPDLQPIRSYENAFLVRMFYILACFINELFGERMALVCRRRTVFALILRQYLRQPIVNQSTTNESTHSLSPQSQRRLSLGQVAPRVSLRWLASYQTLGYLAAAYMFINLWFGAGFVGYIVFLLTLALLYGVVRALVHTTRRRLKQS